MKSGRAELPAARSRSHLIITPAPTFTPRHPCSCPCPQPPTPTPKTPTPNPPLRRCGTLGQAPACAPWTAATASARCLRLATATRLWAPRRGRSRSLMWAPRRVWQLSSERAGAAPGMETRRVPGTGGQRLPTAAYCALQARHLSALAHANIACQRTRRHPATRQIRSGLPTVAVPARPTPTAASQAPHLLQRTQRPRMVTVRPARLQRLCQRQRRPRHKVLGVGRGGGPGHGGKAARHQPHAVRALAAALGRRRAPPGSQPRPQAGSHVNPVMSPAMASWPASPTAGRALLRTPLPRALQHPEDDRRRAVCARVAQRQAAGGLAARLHRPRLLRRLPQVLPLPLRPQAARPVHGHLLG